MFINERKRNANTYLTFILLMWTFGRAPNNASKWEIGFNSVAQRLISNFDSLEAAPSNVPP